MNKLSHYNRLLSDHNLKGILDEIKENLDENQNPGFHSKVLLLSGRLEELVQMKNSISIEAYNLEFEEIKKKIKTLLTEFYKIKGYTKRVFISYNHRDKSVAIKVKQNLINSGIEVQIDSSNMNPGEDIKEFIYRSIENSDTTLSIISSNSLLSSWVSYESINSITGSKITQKKFIGAYIDESFLKTNFTDEALELTKKKIDDLQSRIKVRLDNDHGIADLSAELNRYNKLVNNLPYLIAKLRNSKTVDITNSSFVSGMKKIVESL